MIRKNILSKTPLAALAASVLFLWAGNSPAQTPAPAPAAAATAAKGPEATVEQRLGMLEAYVGNGDPSMVLKTVKDKDGNPALPDDWAKLSPEDLAHLSRITAILGKNLDPLHRFGPRG